MATLLGLLACAPWAIELLSRREYPVPAKGGGVIVTGASGACGDSSGSGSIDRVVLCCAPHCLTTTTTNTKTNPGASTGIGRHAAETLAEQGFVVFAGVRKPADGENVKAADPEHIVPVILVSFW